MAHRLMRERLIPFAVATCVLMAETACDWPWRHDMADQPSRPAAAGPRLPAAGAVPVGGSVLISAESADRLLRNPVPRNAPLARGRRVYSVYCEPCHGPSAHGDGPVAREFAPPMGDLTSPEVQRHADGWLYAVITNGTAHMPRSAYELEPAERWEVVHFLRALGGRRP